VSTVMKQRALPLFLGWWPPGTASAPAILSAGIVLVRRDVPRLAVLGVDPRRSICAPACAGTIRRS
jgi:hypothetical protein